MLMSHLYLENRLLGPPLCSTSSLRPTLVSITWKRRWEEMGGDQLTALKGRGAVGACALFSPHCRGLLHAGRGFPCACALLIHCRGDLTRGGGFVAHAYSFYSTAEPALRLRQFGTFQKARGLGGGVSEGCWPVILSCSSLCWSLQPPSVHLVTCYCINRPHLNYIRIAPFCSLTSNWGIGNWK